MKKQSKAVKQKTARKARQIKEERAAYAFPLVINPKFALVWFDLPGKGVWGLMYSKPPRDRKLTEEETEKLESVFEKINGLVRGKTLQEVIKTGIIKSGL